MTDTNIIDIAKFAGVSVSTVSRVLNNHPDVSEKTKEKVMAVIHEYSYVPNNNARNLKRGSIKAIGVIVKGFTNPFFIDMLTVIQEELSAWRYTMLLQQLDPNQDEVDAAITLIKEKKPRGLIFLGGNFIQQQEKLKLIDIPFLMATITIRENVDQTMFSSVSIDDYREAYNVTERICQSGHQTIAAIGFSPTDRSISNLRIQGFLKALSDQNRVFQENQIAYAMESSMEAGYCAAKKLLAQTKFTCLFCISDILAIGALRAIHEEGYRIPQDVSVVGFDGIGLNRYTIPSLATVKQPGREMAYQSVEILMNCLIKEAPHEHRLFQATFVEGESFSPVL